MIGSYNLSDHVREIADAVETSILGLDEKLKKATDKFMDAIKEQLWDSIRDSLASDSSENFRLAVAYEVRNIITALLVGDEKTIEKLNLVSEYTFHKLHEVRLKIWETCSQGIENSIIAAQEDKIRRLEQQLAYRNNY